MVVRLWDTLRSIARPFRRLQNRVTPLSDRAQPTPLLDPSTMAILYGLQSSLGPRCLNLDLTL